MFNIEWNIFRSIQASPGYRRFRAKAIDTEKDWRFASVPLLITGIGFAVVFTVWNVQEIDQYDYKRLARYEKEYNYAPYTKALREAFADEKITKGEYSDVMDILQVYWDEVNHRNEIKAKKRISEQLKKQLNE